MKGKWKKWTALEKDKDHYMKLIGNKETENDKLKRKVKELQLKLDRKEVPFTLDGDNIDEETINLSAQSHGYLVKESTHL